MSKKLSKPSVYGDPFYGAWKLAQARAVEVIRLRQMLARVVDGLEGAVEHIVDDLQPEFQRLADSKRMSWVWSDQYDQAVAAQRLATWWHGCGVDELVDEARRMLHDEGDA